MKRKLIAVRIIIAAAGIILAVWFVLPIITFGIINIGNMTGIAAGVLLALYGIFAPAVNSLIARLWQRSICRIILSLIAILTAAALLCSAIISVHMIRACLKKPSESDVVVVLGCKVIGEGPSLMLYERLSAAESYLKENEKAVCILSGGQGSDERISEAEAMYRYLVRAGISKDRLILEDRSTTTKENIAFSYEIMKQQGLGSSIAVVTNEFHEYRAQHLAKQLGLNASAVPGRTHWWLFATYVVREWYAIQYEYLNK